MNKEKYKKYQKQISMTQVNVGWEHGKEFAMFGYTIEEAPLCPSSTYIAAFNAAISYYNQVGFGKMSMDIKRAQELGREDGSWDGYLVRDGHDPIPGKRRFSSEEETRAYNEAYKAAYRKECGHEIK